MLIFVLVIVAMSAGWATPTESAALGALATLLVCAAYRALSWKALVQALQGTAAISGVILFIMMDIAKVSLAQMARAVLPFYIPLFFTLLVITYWADFVLAVPRFFGKVG